MAPLMGLNISKKDEFELWPRAREGEAAKR
ncbi:MAG: hypothetical protein BWX84_01686 [Verrucomicrobia bacterium ADurb.Bin118]|jgi:hypothetical protein|nr:MAG: hypothetical protein BWX84_01686 [Verrucomicrobia bacterium ADurb.Bin118]